MPWMYSNGADSSSDGSSEESSAHTSQITENDDYPALSFPGYAEKPLTEQLEPIAVIGMGCRLPRNVTSPAEFWEMMMSKGTGQTPKVPASRFNIDAHFHSNNERPGSFNVLGGYFLDDDLQGFDPALFNISPIEAMWMDPQQRKLLEVVYEAFESGGVSLEKVSGTTTAVFIGSFTSDFQQMSFKEPDFRHSYAATGVDPGIISNRISHVFNLHGPSIAVNTACSSSVYALHNACNALRNHECSGAVVGGTNLVLTVDQHMNTAKLGVLSPTSTCHTFDESADGYGRADAVGAVYLKRLRDAVRDGDPIRALIRSSAVNSNGKVPVVGITYPNCQGQADVIRHAYRRGGNLDPRLTGYFECHGTGTPVGDPIEVNAVANAMNDQRQPDEAPLWIGAVKTNIGHSEAASGLSALIKACLMVEAAIIPPTKGLVRPNPKIEWDNWKVKVVTEPTPFPSHLPVKRVSINSFGYGGTNGHLIIEVVSSFLPDYKHGQAKIKSRGTQNRKRPFLLPFSAHDKATLLRNIAAYTEYVSKYNLHDLSYTLSNRRTHLQSRGFLVTTNALLQNTFKASGEGFSFAETKATPKLGFVFTGQGAQWARMGSQLMTYYPTFAKTIKKLDQALEELHDGPEWTIEDVLLEDIQTSRINEAEFSQPLCTAIQIGIVQLLEHWGIRPTVTVGHSSGEIAAAFAAGLLSDTEAIIVAYYRGLVVRDLNTNGAMLAVGLGAEDVQPYIEDFTGKVVVACHNSPSGVTLSGDAEAITAIEAKLAARNIFARPVKTGGKAYHSKHMETVSFSYKDLILGAEAQMPFDSPTKPHVTMVSSVTNTKLAKDFVLDHEYWCKNLVSPVLFNQAIQTIGTDEILSSVNVLVEIGPHSALSGPIRQICIAHGFDKLNYLPTLVRNEDAAAQLLKTAGELYLRDYKLDMERVTDVETITSKGKIESKRGAILVDLPTYQWNYSKNLWAEPRQSAEHRAPRHDRHDILGRRVPGDSAHNPTWRNILRIRDVPWLRHHSLGGEAVFPAAGYFSMAMEAITQLNEDGANPVQIHGYVLRDVSIKAALVTPDNDTGIEVVLAMQPSVHSEGETRRVWWDFNVSSIASDGHCKDHMTGTIAINVRERGQQPRMIPNLPQRASGKSWNQALRDVGFDYGATFRDMANIQSDGKNFVAASDTTLKKACGIMVGDESRYVIHPGTLDSCLQLIIVSIYAGRINDMKCGAVPIQVDEIAIWPPTAEQLASSKASAFSWTDQRGFRSFVSGSELVAENGDVLMDIKDIRCVAYEAAAPPRLDHATASKPYMGMVWKQDIDFLAHKHSSESMDASMLVNLVAHKNPSARVLLLGCKDTERILTESPLLRCTIVGTSEETYDISQQIASGYKNASAQQMDIDTPFEEQIVVGETYDLVVTSEGLQTAEIFRDVHKHLSGSGRFVLEKATTGTASSESLNANGFFGVEFESSELAVSTVVKADHFATVEATERKLVLLYRTTPDDLVAQINTAAQDVGWTTRGSELKNCEIAAGEHVLLLADLEGSFLASLERQKLKALQHISSVAPSILWITAGKLIQANEPEQAMTAGLARSLTSENALLNLVTLDLELDSTPQVEIAKLIIAVLEKQVQKDSSHESEYLVADGVAQISRMEPLDDLNMTYAEEGSGVQDVPYDCSVRLSGKAESGRVVFEADPRVHEALPANEVEVRVDYAGLNKEGVVVINGVDYPTSFSHEIFGQVTQVGAAVNDLKPGDKVFGFSFDKFSTFQRTLATLVQNVADHGNLSGFGFGSPETAVREISGHMSPQALATLPISYATALHGLGNLEEDDIVLILNGTGAAGLAAVSVCQWLKARPFVVVETQPEAEKLRKEFHLAEERIIFSSVKSIPARLKHLTKGYAADVVFSSGAGDASVARECWRAIAPHGRFVDFGRKNVLKRSVIDSLPLHHGANYHSFDLLEIYKSRPQTLSKLLRLTYKLYCDKVIPAIRPQRIVHLAELDVAVSEFSDSFMHGKPLISYEQTDKTIKVLPSPPVLRFRPEATYLLVGALGGLGRSLGSWMMERGAKHFAFLARSGTDSKQAAILVDDMRDAGASVQVIRGDATIRADVDRALKSISSEHPVRGVVHAAMVLRDGLFHSMSYSDWTTCVKPKVNGAKNLHDALGSTPLDFFIMTSSTSGTLGTPGQANYAAGNAYLDSLAQHRVLQGKPAVSLVLPMVLGVGYVAEHPEVEEALKRKGVYGIDEEHLLRSFEAAMSAQARDAVIIVGMDPAKLQKSIAASETTDGFWLEDKRFTSLLHSIQDSSSSTSSGGGADASILNSMRGAKTAAEAVQLVTDHFTEKLSRLLLIDMAKFDDPSVAIASYGLDSMIGAELRNWIFKEYAIDVPFQQLLGDTLTIRKFAAQVCANQGIVEEKA